MLEWLGNRFVKRDIRVNRNGQQYSQEQQYHMVMQYYLQESALNMTYRQ